MGLRDVFIIKEARLDPALHAKYMSPEINKSGTVSEAILRYLEDHPEGLRFGEIQRFYVDIVQGHDYDEPEAKGAASEFEKDSRPRPNLAFSDDPNEPEMKSHYPRKMSDYFRRKYRGYGITLLMGGQGDSVGLLQKFCSYDHETRRYKLTKPIGSPFTRWDPSGYSKSDVRRDLIKNKIKHKMKWGHFYIPDYYPPRENEGPVVPFDSVVLMPRNEQGHRTWVLKRFIHDDRNGYNRWSDEVEDIADEQTLLAAIAAVSQK
jgi:hypothetical protein